MRQIFHPPIEHVTVEGILHAFADPVRMRIFMELANAECTKSCSAFLNVSTSPLPKSTLSQHFKVLREAGLIYSERKGVELLNHTRCNELKKRFGDMVPTILQAYAEQQKNKSSAQKKRKQA